MATTTRYVGTCPVCDRFIKVRGGKLVHHGYERPGYGHIVGDCFAVHMTPHEVDSSTAKSYGDHLTVRLEGLEKHKADVAGATELSYTYTKRLGFQEKETRTIQVKLGDLRRYEGSEIPSFEDVKKQILWTLDRQIEKFRSEIERMAGLVASWTEQPLITVEEYSERVTAELKAQRAAKKAERDAKKAPQLARRAARQAKLQIKIDAAKAKAHAILDKVDPTDVKAVREAYILALTIKLPGAVQYTFWDEHLDRTELLRSAGLIREHNGRLMTYEGEVRDLIAGRER